MRTITEELKYVDVFPESAGKLAQKLKIKKDEIPFIRKSYISEKSEVDTKERSVISYISTMTKDRDNEQLMPNGVSLDNYRLNPIVLYGHDYKSLPIGKNVWIKQDERGLIAKTIFAKNEFADQIYRAYTEDIEGTGPLLKGWSVGFIPRKWEEPKEKDAEDAPRRIYTEWELLEYSAVPIPSCPEALTLAYEKGLISDRLKKDLDLDMEIIDFEPEDTEAAIGDLLEERMDTIEAKDAEDLGDVSTEEIEAVTAVEVKPIEKVFDTEGNPSVREIEDAIWRMLNPPVAEDVPVETNREPNKWLDDLYPLNYPHGRVVISMDGESGIMKSFLYDYTYSQDGITFGDNPVPVVVAYREKQFEPGKMTVDVRITDLPEFEEYLKELKEELTQLVKQEEPDDDPEFTIEPDDDPEVTIEPDDPEPDLSIADIVKAELKNIDLPEIIRTEVSNTIKRLKGQVE